MVPRSKRKNCQTAAGAVVVFEVAKRKKQYIQKENDTTCAAKEVAKKVTRKEKKGTKKMDSGSYCPEGKELGVRGSERANRGGRKGSRSVTEGHSFKGCV